MICFISEQFLFHLLKKELTNHSIRAIVLFFSCARNLGMLCGVTLLKVRENGE